MYKIVGSYKGGCFEEIDTATTENQATYLLEEYRLAYGDDWIINYYKIDE